MSRLVPKIKSWFTTLQLRTAKFAILNQGMKNTSRRLGRTVLSIALIAAAAFALGQRQAIYDWWRLRNYTPPSVVSQLATDDTMTPSARHIFYVYHPELDDKSNFSSHCGDLGEQTIVLGCYTRVQGIYIFTVTDERLNGVEEVTAAHEMLHAAYDRLSVSDKQRVNALINQAYAGITDERIRANIENYRKQGADVTNELHSILGTEVSNLPTQLEQYYQRYFTNRQQVVSYSDKYEGTFTALKKQADQLQTKLKSLRSSIDLLSAQLLQEHQELEAERQHINSQAAADAFNARVRNYNSQVGQLNEQIQQYNGLITQLEQLVVLQQQLFQAINSSPTTVPTQ